MFCAPETVPMLIWLTVSLSCFVNIDHQMLPLLTRLPSSAVMSLTLCVRVVSQAPQRLKIFRDTGHLCWLLCHQSISIWSFPLTQHVQDSRPTGVFVGCWTSSCPSGLTVPLVRICFWSKLCGSMKWLHFWSGCHFTRQSSREHTWLRLFRLLSGLKVKPRA